MAWITPIYNRTLADVTNKTSIGVFNVLDWNRITGNIAVVLVMANANVLLNIAQNSLTQPTATTIPSVVDINNLAQNIELIRAAIGIPITTGCVPINYAYQSGMNGISPNYNAVNTWELDLNLIYIYLPPIINYREPCGVAACGQAHFRQNLFRRYI